MKEYYKYMKRVKIKKVEPKNWAVTVTPNLYPSHKGISAAAVFLVIAGLVLIALAIPAIAGIQIFNFTGFSISNIEENNLYLLGIYISLILIGVFFILTRLRRK